MIGLDNPTKVISISTLFFTDCTDKTSVGTRYVMARQPLDEKGNYQWAE